MPPVNRRDLLKAASGAATITGLTSVVGASGNTVEIVTVRDGDEIVRTAKVPKSWYQRVTHTRNIRNKSAGEHLNKRGVLRISRTAGDRRLGGKRAPVIRMEYDPETYKGNVPDEMEGVPIRKEEGKPTVPTCLNHSNFDQIPGGVHLNESGGGVFTSFAPAEKNGSNWMVTCAHPWDACDGESREGEDVDQYYDQYGELGELHHEIDVARTSLTDTSKSFVGEIEAAARTYTIEGVATENGLDNYMSLDATIRKIGTSSGDTTGEIMDVNVSRSSCPTLRSQGVRLTNRQARGDSGGPAIRGYSDGRATLVNINTFGYHPIIGTDCNNDTFEDALGTAAHYIENYGYSFT